MSDVNGKSACEETDTPNYYFNLNNCKGLAMQDLDSAAGEIGVVMIFKSKIHRPK